jgi:hypothetical protein
MTTELDPATAAWLAAARAARTEIARLEEICTRATGHVQAAMGDHEEATVGGRPAVTWAWSKPGKRLDRKALEADHGPEFVAKYLVENTPARPFRILDVT